MSDGPYQLWVKQCGEWKLLVRSHCPTEIKEAALNTISTSSASNVERVEIRDLDGVLETTYDKSWK